MKEIDNVLITIGIPFYNAEKYLEQAIHSVINQTYTNWELILLDDGSVDRSLDIAKSFNDPRIKLISDGENKGLVIRLNQLTTLINGIYYARMDADDIMHYERISKQLKFLLNNPEVDVVGSRYYSIDINNKIVGITDVNLTPDSVHSFLKSGCFAHPTILGKSEWFRNNPYNENWNTMMEDYELWLRTISISNFTNIKEPLLFYRSVGVPTLKKYSRQTFNVIKLIQKRKYYNIDFFDMVYYSFVNLLKIIIYFLFYLIGGLEFIVKKRSKSISNKEFDEATKILNISIM